MKQTFEFTDEEVLTIVTALGVLKSRIGQRERWLQRKRMVTLRGRLADCITIGDETEADGVRKAMAITKKKIENRAVGSKKVADLMNEIKQQTGITDERRCSRRIEGDGGGVISRWRINQSICTRKCRLSIGYGWQRKR